jgi:membrane protease YdiL (CAAX protease family)
MAETKSGYLVAAAVTLSASGALAYAFVPLHGGTLKMYGTIAGAYVALLIGTLLWMKKRDQLKRLIPKRGDVTIGALLAVGMYMLATVAHLALTDRGSPREPWMMRVYLQIGDPRIATSVATGAAVLALASVEEVVWRGWVLGALREMTNANKAWLITSALYALAHVPTIYMLRDPDAGLNPLVFMAALGGGLLWGFLAVRLDRLGPSICAHALFSWSVVSFPIWRM